MRAMSAIERIKRVLADRDCSLTAREVAAEAGCSVSWARQVLRRLAGTGHAYGRGLAVACGWRGRARLWRGCGELAELIETEDQEREIEHVERCLASWDSEWLGWCERQVA